MGSSIKSINADGTVVCESKSADANTLDGLDSTDLLNRDSRIAMSRTDLVSSITSTTATIAEVGITVPGTARQYVHVSGSATVSGDCNCNYVLFLEEADSGLQSSWAYNRLNGTYDQETQQQEWVFLAEPGTHTYSLKGRTSPDTTANVGPVTLFASTVPLNSAGRVTSTGDEFTSEDRTTSRDVTP